MPDLTRDIPQSVGIKEFLEAPFRFPRNQRLNTAIDIFNSDIDSLVKENMGLMAEIGQLKIKATANGLVMETQALRKYQRIELRLVELIGLLRQALPQQKKYAKKLLDHDQALIDAWNRSDAEENKIRAIAREEIAGK